MLEIRRSAERGHFNHGWLDTYHTFSFADYQDPQHIRFRALRVMNEDRVAPGQGFGKHPHRDMEIVTYVLSGALQHEDSMGHGEVLRPGEFQRMSAGTGIMHSEFNPSESEAVHLYQIWLLPEEKGLEPSYEQRSFADAEKQNQWRVVASPDARDQSLSIHQDAVISLALLDHGKEITYALDPHRFGWLQVLRGEIEFMGEKLQQGDGVAISDETQLSARAVNDSELILFDLA